MVTRWEKSRQEVANVREMGRLLRGNGAVIVSLHISKTMGVTILEGAGACRLCVEL
jgi:hypothetical protein